LLTGIDFAPLALTFSLSPVSISFLVKKSENVSQHSRKNSCASQRGTFTLVQRHNSLKEEEERSCKLFFLFFWSFRTLFESLVSWKKRTPCGIALTGGSSFTIFLLLFRISQPSIIGTAAWVKRSDPKRKRGHSHCWSKDVATRWEEEKNSQPLLLLLLVCCVF
jgi:hypothetical protein